MWESSGLGNEDLLWATTNFVGGIAGEREAVCGAVSGAAVYLGLRLRVPLEDKDNADRARQQAREKAYTIVKGFTKEHGSIICGKLLGIDFADEAAVKQFRESGQWRQKCDGYVCSVIRMLYGLEAK